MPRRNYTKGAHAYRRRLERKACERREELRELEHELHQEWREQHPEGAVDTSPVDGAVPVKPLTPL